MFVAALGLVALVAWSLAALERAAGVRARVPEVATA
jgi:hypothetical protein